MSYIPWGKSLKIKPRKYMWNDFQSLNSIRKANHTHFF